MPVFFQLVKGASATDSGLYSIPLMFGVSVFSVLTGQLISRYKRIKLWIFIGAVLLIVGEVLLSTMMPSTNLKASLTFLLITGIGIGCIIQARILAIQSAVQQENIAFAITTVIMKTFTLEFFCTIHGGLFGNLCSWYNLR